MDKRQKKPRQAPFSYRPPEGLRQEFERRVAASGLTVSGFITKQCLGQVLPSQQRIKPDHKKDLARLLHEAAQIRLSLEQCCHEGNGAARIDEAIEKTYAELVLLRTLIMQELGRKS